MSVRILLSGLFLTAGILFFALAGLNAWESRNAVPLDEITSLKEERVDLKRLTSRPLVRNSTLDLPEVDILTLVVMPANYGCGACSEQASAFINGLKRHPSFQSLSMTTAGVIVEVDRRVATHFARVQKLSTPVYQTTTVPARGSDESAICSALLVDPNTATAFFKVHLTRASVTPKSDAVFEAARDAYRQHLR